MFKKYEEHTVVAYGTSKMDCVESKEVIMDVIEGGYYHDLMHLVYNEDNTIEITFKCTKKEFKDIERILYALRRNESVKLGVMTLV